MAGEKMKLIRNQFLKTRNIVFQKTILLSAIKSEIIDHRNRKKEE
jgi:hypothetical protein